MNRKSTEDFQGRGNTLCDTVGLDTCHYTSVHTHSVHEVPRVTPRVHYGLRVTMACRY